VAGSIAHTRQRRRGTLSAAVRKAFDDSGGSYGSPRVGDQLGEQGRQVCDNTIARPMAEHGLVARAKRRRRGPRANGRPPRT
jgi:putative transposase